MPFAPSYIALVTAQGDKQREGANWLSRYDTQDAIYDTAWSELNENQLVAGCGDGSVKLYDLSAPGNLPVQNWHEHGREVYATSWNLISKDTLASSSWDGTIKLVRMLASTPLQLHHLGTKQS